MVVVLALCTLRFTTGCQATRAVIVADLFILQLSPAPLLSLRGCISPGVNASVTGILTLRQRRVCEWPSCVRGDGARYADSAHATSYARKHSAKLALNARFGSRSGLL